jgi:bifunctional DNA-binding transcriptional regulator/antitoxin component of YhaV-PrlF toxin-antitoxin module
MPTLTVTSKGQVTLRKELLTHLGVRAGQRVDVTVLPGGRLQIQAERPPGTIEGFLALLAGRSGRCASLEELDAAAADGWAGIERPSPQKAPQQS